MLGSSLGEQQLRIIPCLTHLPVTLFFSATPPPSSLHVSCGTSAVLPGNYMMTLIIHLCFHSHSLNHRHTFLPRWFFKVEREHVYSKERKEEQMKYLMGNNEAKRLTRMFHSSIIHLFIYFYSISSLMRS